MGTRERGLFGDELEPTAPPTPARTVRSNLARWRPAGHPGQELLTPEYVLERVRRALGGIELDPCSTADNPTGAERWYYLPVRDGLAEPWRARSVFVNPPYGDARRPFVLRALEAGQDGVRVALLVPAHTDTELTQAVLAGAGAVTFIAGRLDFGARRSRYPDKPWRATHPSLLATWGAELEPLAELGVTLRP